jgi:quercetin dioxygenase-like cupin family protein
MTGAVITRNDGARDEGSIRAVFSEERLAPHAWSNGPGFVYGSHEHAYHKVLYCLRGSITFELANGTSVTLGSGDRLDLKPGTRHGAVVGPDGVECLEAARQ